MKTQTRRTATIRLPLPLRERAGGWVSRLRDQCAWILATTGILLLSACVAQTNPTDQPTPTTAPTESTATATPIPTHINDDKTLILYNADSDAQWADNFIHQESSEPSAWLPQDDGSIQVRGGNAATREHFGDHQIHLEFFLPDMPEKQGQARANSGVYVHGRYEVQVLDTFGQDPFPGGCGGIYSIAPPLVNASLPADNWQTYDIVFRAPRFDEAGAITEHPRITVIHNGIVVHNNLTLPHVTPGGLDEVVVARGPLMLQDHGDAVRYRNVWVRRLD